MSAPRLKVVLTRRLPDAVETRMRELFDAELNLSDAPMDRAALEAAVRRADVLVPTITDAIDAGLIAAAGEQLKMIASFGAGVNHIDVEPAVHPGLLGHANVVLLPHLGSATLEARQDMGDRVIANILTFQNGHRPPDRVIPAML